MAFRDIRTTFLLNPFDPATQEGPERPDRDIEKFFFELSRELGVEDPDFMPAQDAGADGGTLVYDKFDLPRR